MLHKDFGLEIKSANDAGEIEGYGSTFGGEPDSYGDIIEKGAFDETIRVHKAAGTMPAMLWGHNSGDVPIGDWVDMAEDDKGLWLKGRIDLADPVGERVYRAVKSKRVRGLSIGYDVAKSRDEKRGIRILEKLNLWEVSAVNFPANINAGFTAVKQNDSFASWMAGVRPQLRELEGFLKEGFNVSNSEAERMASALLNEVRGGRDEPADPLAELWAAMSNAPIIDLTGEPD